MCWSRSAAFVLDVFFFATDVISSTTAAVFGALFLIARLNGEGAACAHTPLFILICGGGNLALSIWRFVRPVPGSLAAFLFNLCMIVYGSVVAFGRSTDYSYYLCDDAPFDMAVSTLVAFVAYYACGVLFYLMCCVWVYLRVTGRGENDDAWAYSYSAGYIYCSLHYFESHCGQIWDESEVPVSVTRSSFSLA